MITIKELFTIYWSQFTIILLGLGYFIKRLFDSISKKNEINHTLFQQKRLDAVNKFYLNYSDAQQMWKNISTLNIFQNNLSAIEIDKIIQPHINSLKSNILELQIYFDQKEHNLFQRIFNNIENVNQKLSTLYFDYDEKNSVVQKSNSFHTFRAEKLKDNETIFIELSVIIKETFKS